MSLDSLGQQDPALGKELQAASDFVDEQLHGEGGIEAAMGRKEQEWARRAGQTHGGSGDYADRIADLEDQGVRRVERASVPPEQRRQAERAAQTEVSTQDYLEYDEPDWTGEGEFDPAAGEQFLGLPIKPASDAQARTLQMLDIIDEYPDHPPAQQAKADILAGPQFQQYKELLGYEGMNDSDVWKEMKREANAEMRDNRREFRRRRKENVELGLVKPRVGKKKTVQVKQVSPVAGDRSVG